MINTWKGLENAEENKMSYFLKYEFVKPYDTCVMHTYCKTASLNVWGMIYLGR